MSDTVTEYGDHRGELARASVDELLQQAKGIVEDPGLTSTSSGWMAVRELDYRFNLDLDEEVLKGNLPGDAENAIQREAVVGQLFVTLQRMADKYDVDVDYGLDSVDVSNLPDANESEY